MGADKSEKLTLFDFDDAQPLFDTGVMSTPVLTDPDVAMEPFVEWGSSPGHDVKVLYRGEGDDGFSLLWSWFGPGYALPRHSHSADCLYYVVKGEAHLGNRVVGAGGGFFVPADAPYAYTAGPDGIEILEFRIATSFDMVISEGAARFDQIVANARANRDTWAARADAR